MRPQPRSRSSSTSCNGARLAHAFQRWSDGGAQSHMIVTPAAPTTYTAKFTRGKG